MWPWTEEPDTDDALVTKARTLVLRPRALAGSEPPTDPIDPRTAPLVAQRLCAQEIPLARGHNSAAYVGWLGEDMGQTTTVAAARNVLEANAYRDWLWTGTHRTLNAAELETFTLIVGRYAHPRHPLRLQEIIEAVTRGRPTAEHRLRATRLFPDLDGRPGPTPTPELWARRLDAGKQIGRVSQSGLITWSSRGL